MQVLTHPVNKTHKTCIYRCINIYKHAIGPAYPGRLPSWSPWTRTSCDRPSCSTSRRNSLHLTRLQRQINQSMQEAPQPLLTCSDHTHNWKTGGRTLLQDHAETCTFENTGGHILLRDPGETCTIENIGGQFLLRDPGETCTIENL